MAQLDPIHSGGDNPRHSSTRHRVDEAQNGLRQIHPSPTISSRSQEVIHDPEYAHYPPKKLTVMAKVKEKARRWKLNFSKKKHNDDNSTPSWGVSLEDEDEEDPEYLGAPMYESELAPELYKEHAREHPRDPIVSEKNVWQSSVDSGTWVESQDKMIDSKNQCLSREMEDRNASNGDADKQDTQEAYKDDSETDDTPVSPSERSWDAGISMKEFIKNKLEPGDDEKALSQVISDVMSPRKSTTTVGGVIEIFKGAVSSILGRGDPDQSSSAANSSSHECSLSNNEPAVEDEQVEGRILQNN